MGGITSILISEWLDLLHVVCVLKVDLAMDGITVEPGGLEIYHPLLIEKTGNNEEISLFGSARLRVLQFSVYYRMQNDHPVLRFQARNSSGQTWNRRLNHSNISITNTTAITTQPTAPPVTISDASGAITNPGEPPTPGEPPSYSSIVAASHMHRMRTPGLSPRSGATPFDPPPEYEEVVL